MVSKQFCVDIFAQANIMPYFVQQNRQGVTVYVFGDVRRAATICEGGTQWEFY